MDMSWLIILFFLNGQPIMLNEFPAKLWPTEICAEQRVALAALFGLAFPERNGIVFCVPKPEVPGVSS